MVEIIKKAREGDHYATEALVDSLRPRITKMAAYYGRCCGEDPDDLLQEAWIGLLEALPHLDLGIGSPEQHLIARAKWRLLDAIKRAKVRRCLSLDGVEAGQLPHDDSERAVAEACASEFTGKLNDTRKAVLGCLLAGLTWRETGTVLNCTSANVAYHVRQIRRQYEEWAEDDLKDSI